MLITETRLNYNNDLKRDEAHQQDRDTVVQSIGSFHRDQNQKLSQILHTGPARFFFRNVDGNLSLTCTFFFSPSASLRAELNHLHATSIEHLKQIHLKENNVAKRELESAMEHSHKQVGESGSEGRWKNAV